jgi:hypothetical protein
MASSSVYNPEGIRLRTFSTDKYALSEFSTNNTLPDYASGSLPSYASTIGDTSTINCSLLSGKTFVATSSLQIQAQGKPVCGIPLPLKEQEIPIFSITSSRPVYISIRPQRRWGNCFLVDAEDDSQTAIARTTYWFGPGRYPLVRIGKDEVEEADEFQMIGTRMFSRSVGFECKWGRFEWRYAGRTEKAVVGGGVHSLLVLDKVSLRREGGKERVRVAQFKRGEGTRTPGSQHCSAGNGGRLEMCLRSEAEDGEEGEMLVDEITVVMTCMVMMKKEVDRLRAIQMIVTKIPAF